MSLGMLVFAFAGLFLIGCGDALDCESAGLVRMDGRCVNPDAGASDASVDVGVDAGLDLDAAMDAATDTRNIDGCMPSDETCNGMDDDCDGMTDEALAMVFYEDQDGDTIGNDAETCDACDVSDCPPERRWVAVGGDCNDDSDVAAPGLDEVCDELDNDCDDETDEGVTTTFYLDADGDGFGDDDMTREACAVPEGYVEAGGDCAPEDGEAFPGQTQYYARRVMGVGGYDFDCNGVSEPQISLSGTPMCDTTCTTQEHWLGSVPSCGGSATTWECLAFVLPSGAPSCTGDSVETEDVQVFCH